ncbi:MAG: hypothetical protein ACRDYY_02025 [Acidimicrobiales bacterium]
MLQRSAIRKGGSAMSWRSGASVVSVVALIAGLVLAGPVAAFASGTAGTGGG